MGKKYQKIQQQQQQQEQQPQQQQTSTIWKLRMFVSLITYGTKIELNYCYIFANL